MGFPITSPYSLFTDRSGDPLNSGYIYIGVANTNPQTNPISVYWDSELTIPTSQPLRTSGGYIFRNGTPANVFVGSSCSVTIRDRDGELVYSTPNLDSGISILAGPNGASLIGFIQAGAGAIAETVQSYLRREVIPVTSFMTNAQRADVLARSFSLDLQSAVTVAIAAAPSGSTLRFPDGGYNFGGGFIINKPLHLVGDGRGTHIKMTGIATSSCLFYMGGATPNGTPNPAYPGTVYNAGTGTLTAGQTSYTFASVTNLAVGDKVFMALGIDPTDGGQHFFRMWNQVANIVGTTVTMEVPLPEAVGIGGGWGQFAFSPTFNEVVKFTTIVENAGVSNMAIEHVAGPAYDIAIFFLRCRNMYKRDIFMVRTEAGLDDGETENSVTENIYGQNCARDFVSAYGSRNWSGKNLVGASISGTGVYFENQMRGANVDGALLQANASKGSNSFINVLGGSSGVRIKGAQIVNIALPTALALNVDSTVTDVQTEDVQLWSGMNFFPLKYHTGLIRYNGAAYRDRKTYHLEIALDINMVAESFSIPSGLTRTLRGKITNKTGITLIMFGNTTYANAYNSYDPGNVVDHWPTVNTFGNFTSDQGITLGTAVDYQFNQDPLGKVMKISTDGTVVPGSILILEIETFRPVNGDDGVDGYVQVAVP